MGLISKCRRIYATLAIVLSITFPLLEVKCASIEKNYPAAKVDEETIFITIWDFKHLSQSGQLQLRAFGEDLNLILRRTNQLATPLAQIIRRHNGETVSQKRLGLYYSGYISQKSGSSVTLNVANGTLSGILFVPDFIMTIRPLNDGNLHVITREKHENATLGTESPFFTNFLRSKRTKRSASSTRYVEVMIVADRYTTEAFGNFTENYVMSVAYLLNAVFQDSTIGRTKFIYKVVKIMVISGYEKGLDLTENNVQSASSYLSLFATFTKNFNRKSDDDPLHFDQAILITKKVCGLGTSCHDNGRAYLGTMCHPTHSVVTTFAAGLNAALSAAHESAHTLGVHHDLGKCSTGGYIMNGALPSGGNAFQWSPCSRKTFEDTFIDRKRFSCLNDKPAGIDLKENVSVLNLGRNYSGDEQCRLMYDKSYTHCYALRSNCKILLCHQPGKSVCIHRFTPPLEGTECGTYKWCRKGECVDRPIPAPIDGQWSSWSETFSTCTTSCGMGVRYRTRTCDSPKPQYFGKNCVGDSKGHYETCNTQDCPPGTPTFRRKQCQHHNPSFVDYFDGNSPCKLLCRSGNYVIKYQTLKDGTLCSHYKDAKDVCVMGKCKKVGCDRTFDRKFYDRCRVCSGNGSTCHLIKSSYKERFYSHAGDSDVMFILPAGSVNVRIHELKPTYNNIGLKDQKDNWIIDSNTRTSILYFAGSRIMFERPHSRSAEKMDIIGPTTEPLKVMFIFWYELNEDIPYEYYQPLTTTDSNNRKRVSFVWKYTLSKCSEKCAGGVKTKITTCHRSDDDTEVGLRYCDPATEPNGTIVCNTLPCQPSWQYDTWSVCNVSCGPGGARSRKVECRQTVSSQVTRVVADNLCTGNKPASSVTCNLKDCLPEWVHSNWSTCSNEKCEGIQTRSLTCKQMFKNGLISVRDDAECPRAKPMTEIVCNAGLSCFEWKFVYPNCTECRGHYTGGLRNSNTTQYKSVGCYRIQSKPFGPMLSKLVLNTRDKVKTVAECARLAWNRARRVFALGGNGECYGSMDGHRVYHKDGASSDCVDNLIGGPDSAYVFALTGKVLLSTPMCKNIENNTNANISNCQSDKPPPEMKVCCEDTCKDQCFRTVNGSYCSIPFLYRGKKYYECILNKNGTKWCATTSNYDVDGIGENCEEPCRSRTASGTCCSFPFIYQGQLYNSCITTAGSTHAWCALTSNYDRDRLWGNCT